MRVTFNVPSLKGKAGTVIQPSPYYPKEWLEVRLDGQGCFDPLIYVHVKWINKPTPEACTRCHHGHGCLLLITPTQFWYNICDECYIEITEIIERNKLTTCST